MSFLFPAFLAGALAIAIPIVLHFARREAAPRLPFSDIRFLQRVPLVQAHRRRIREWLLLALRIAALLLLALAFARPFFDATGLAGRPVTVVAVDRSFSMSQPGRFERARAAARAAISEAPPGDLVGLVMFDDRARVAAEPTTDRAAAAAALERAAPGFGATRYAAALAAAARSIGSRDGRIVVITDLQRTGWEAAGAGVVPPGVTVRTVDVGAAGSNLAVTAIEIGPAGAAAVVTNTGARTRSSTVALRVDGNAVESAAVELAPGAITLSFDAAPPSAGVLEVAVDDPGGLPADDRRYWLLDGPAPLAIALVTADARAEAGALYLERALLAAGDDSPFVVRQLAPASISAAALDGVAAALLLETAGFGRSARAQLAAYVNAGGGLLIALGPRLDPALVAEFLGTDPAPAPHGGDGALTWSVTATRHPLFAAFDGLAGVLGQVRFRQAMRVGGADGRVLAAFSDGAPALVERTAGRGRVLVFASDLNNEWNDFPRQSTFVPFVHEAVRYLGGRRRPVRELLVADAPRGVEPRPGATVDPASGRPIVLNVDPRESDPSRLTAAEFGARIRRAAVPADAAASEPVDAAGREAEQRYWWYLLLAMAFVLVAESWLGRTAA